jgi:hypothetical protein
MLAAWQVLRPSASLRMTRLAEARAFAQDDAFGDGSEENKQQQKKLRVFPLRIA